MQLYSYTVQAGANTELKFIEIGQGSDSIPGFADEGYHGTYLSQISIEGGTVLDDEAQTTDVNPGPDAVGIPDGPGDEPGAGGYSEGKIYFNAGADGLKAIEFTSVLVNNQPLQAILVNPVTGQGTPEGVTAVWHQNANDAGGTYIGTGASGQEVFTLVVEADGSYEFTLHAPLAHSETEPAFEDNLNLSFGFSITDGDNDKAEGSFTINVDDDFPDGTFTVSEGQILVHDETYGDDADAGRRGNGSRRVVRRCRQ